MSTKRTLTALAGIAAGLTLLVGCTNTSPAPTPTTSSAGTPTPSATPTSITGEAPADENEAISQAEATIDLLLSTQAQISAAGGTDPSRYEAVATGRTLEEFQEDATRIANGPLLNVDGDEVEGQSKVEGSLIFEPTTAYGQEWEGVTNGLIIVPGCLDGSERKITTADGKPAMQNPNPRNEVEFHVIYDADSKTWLVNDRISLGTTC